MGFPFYQVVSHRRITHDKERERERERERKVFEKEGKIESCCTYEEVEKWKN